MTKDKEPVPPRRIEPGDVVAVYCEELGAWTAAQITGLDFEAAKAGVLDLDWSGPEPMSVADLGDVRPLRLTHHKWTGKLAHCNYEWLLPRSYKVIGSLPLFVDLPSNAYSFGWGVGVQLFYQRRWDRGERDAWTDPSALLCTGEEIALLLEQPAEPDRAVRRLTLRDVAALDVGGLVARFPALTSLTMSGDLGTLSGMSTLNQLGSLKRLFIKDLFGMDASDCLVPSGASTLEALQLHSVPAEYAAAMETAWRPEAARGTHVHVSQPRQPGWVAENRDNPFRDWDGDDYVPRGIHKKALAQYKKTRDEVFAVLSEPPSDDQGSRMVEIGERYGEAFNALDARHGFIDTIERERLFDVLDHIISAAEARFGTEFPWARESLTEGTESVRDW